MDLYALLIGIDDYPYDPLRQCKSDVNKVQQYLESIESHFDHIYLKKLTDSNASKANIVEGICKFLAQAKDSDVCLMYYSGHGGQEETAGLFVEEYDGLMECLVCHHTETSEAGFLLADKEIRFLFSQWINSPHLVTIFDCCHSGDMVRAYKKNPAQGAIRRIVEAFPPRIYEDFIFHNFNELPRGRAVGVSYNAPT